MKLTKIAVSKEIKAISDKFDEVKDPAERKKLYMDYQRAVHEDRNPLHARAVKGALGGALAVSLIRGHPYFNLYNRTRALAGKPPVSAKLMYGVGTGLGTLAGIRLLKKRPKPVTSLEQHYGEKPKKDTKTAGLPESRYWPMGDAMGMGSQDTTVADLDNPHMTDALRKRILKSGVVIKSKAGKEDTNAFTAGGRALHMRGKHPKEDRPAILAHELGHHRRRHLSKSMVTGLASGAAGSGIGAVVGHQIAKHMGEDRDGRKAGMAIGATVGGLLASKTVPSLIASEVHEREADRYGARKTSPEDMKRALTNIHRHSFDTARKETNKSLAEAAKKKAKAGNPITRWWHGSTVKQHEAKLKNLDTAEKAHFERPDTKFKRGLSRFGHGVLGSHPPLWSRHETLDEEAKARDEIQKKKTAEEAFNPTYTPTQGESFKQKTVNYNAQPSDYAWKGKLQNWNRTSDPRSKSLAFKSKLKSLATAQAL